MADDDDAGALSDVDEDPLPPPPPPSSSSIPIPSSKPQPHAEAQQRLLDLTAELESERRLRRAAEESLASSETRLGRLKAFAQDALRKRDESAAAAAASARSLQALQSEAATASSMLASGLERISAKASPSTPPAPLPTSHKYSAGLPALAYGVLKRANDIVDDLLAQIAAARRDRDDRNYQIAIEVSELEAALASRAAEAESLSKSLSDRDADLSALRDQVAALDAALRPLLADQIGCASKLYDEVRQLVALVDPDAAGALPDSVFVWKEADIEESLKVSLEGTRMAFDIAAMALHKVAAWRDRGSSKVSELQGKVEELVREKEHIGVLLRSALQANTSEVLKVAEDGLREAGIEIGLNGHRDHRPGSAQKDEVYTLAGALENSMKESQIKIIELQHLVEAQRAESGLLRTRMEGQEKEVGQLRKQIKHLEEKERLANDSVEGLMMDVTAAEEEIKRWKMAAEEEADAGRSIEQEFQIQLTSLHKELEEAKESMLELENKLKFKEETAAAAMAARDAAEKSLKLADTRSARLRERLEELNRQAEESEGRADPSSGSGRHRYMCWPWQWLGLNYVRLPPAETEEASNEMELSEPLI
ncbi:myosin heavy chain, embryonic smooth muscle isoform-like [Lolium rigidum]|uniref:myosin heavy chain, embryonic smooth muscle isoform-like n=1 Tax=Lolium rigidum TaxID=89674 RepID=UPI001F5D2DD3|nr:myosin heavy chain, embryonic smooth muscle isoform-like [Lolium rigidum]